MGSLTIANARLLTIAPHASAGPRRGAALRDLGLIERGHVCIEDGRVTSVGPGGPPRSGPAPLIDAAGRVVMPGFVDCHTHACWAGDRFDEFQLRQAGASYLQVLAAGGGIMSTVRAVRAASEEHLSELLMGRLRRMAALGTGTVEVKSGYGLETASEMKMLRAIAAAGRRTPLRVCPTFLGAHAIDRDTPRFVEETIEQTLPAVARAFPGITCDAFCEEGAWSLADTRRYLERARGLGCPVRVHGDQFHSLGATRLAIELGAMSVDHLEAVDPADIPPLAASATIAVALPCCGFHLDGRYAPARAIADAGGAVAIATNYNPGSAPTPSMQFALALATRKLGLTAAEAIVAATHNAACVLGIEREAGSIAPGRRGDLQMWDCTDERELGYEIALPGPLMVVAGGAIIARRDLVQ